MDPRSTVYDWRFEENEKDRKELVYTYNEWIRRGGFPVVVKDDHVFKITKLSLDHAHLAYVERFGKEYGLVLRTKLTATRSFYLNT